MFVQVTAPELDQQITQAEATLGQNARVTWARDKPWSRKDGPHLSKVP
jgi:hypothetical protein